MAHNSHPFIHPAMASRTADTTALAVYVHIPFCQTRCTYCAFNTYAGLTRWIEPYTKAVIREIERIAASGYPASTHSLYFGGGTPSQLPAESVERIARAINAHLTPIEPWEFSFEMNPGDANGDYLAHLRRIGVNRLSIGMQSANEDELRFFGRRHTNQEVSTAIDLAREAGIENINLDLIYGLPDHSMKRWQHSIETALRFEPAHLSLYSLSIEAGTALQRRIDRGQCSQPDPDLAADMYEWASERLVYAGYRHYEISNWARPGYECHHNLHVWRNQPYLGLGAGAHGYAGHIRTRNVERPEEYVDRLQAQASAMQFPLTAATEEALPIARDEEMIETVILGLRLTEDGIDDESFHRRFNQHLSDIFGPQLERLITLELLERVSPGRYRLMPRGRLLGNRVFAEFI